MIAQSLPASPACLIASPVHLNPLPALSFRDAMKGVKKPASDIIDGLENRFPHNELLSAFQIFDPRELPSELQEWERTASRYGLIVRLVAPYSPTYLLTYLPTYLPTYL